MGSYLDGEGRFQSDKYPELPPDKIIFSFRDSEAHKALHLFAEHASNEELGADIKERLRTIQEEGERQEPKE